jgi:hypothetical protein
MRPIRTLLLLAFGISVTAAEPQRIAGWTAGEGTVAEQPSTGQAPIGPGMVVAAPAGAPARIDLALPAVGSVTLAPGAAVTLRPGGAGDRDLVIEVVSGAAQLDLADKGTWRSVLLRGGPLEARVLKGTALAEAGKDSGYLVLVRGALSAHALAGKDAARWVPLKQHQGIGGSADGLGSNDDLATRPQLDQPLGKAGGLRQQGVVPPADDAAAGWRRDAATSTLAALVVADDAALAAWLAVGLTRIDSQAGAIAVGRAAAGAPTLAADLAVTVVSCVPGSAADVGTAVIGAVPARAAEVVGAVSAAAPDSAADLTVAALSAAPEHAKEIVAAAVKAAPASKDAIIGVASALAPEAAEAAQATP